MADVQRAAFGDPSGSGVNFGVKEVAGLDYDVEDFLTTKVYHGVSIVAGSSTDNSDSTVIGRIQSWQPDSYTRSGVHLYELASTSWGRPVEYVPGKAEGFTIAVTRAEVWGSEMERAFNKNGSQSLYEDLIDQNFPFTIKEFWIRGSQDTAYSIWTYRGCWFQNKNIEALTSDGDGVTRINASIAYVSKSHTGTAVVSA